MRHLSRRLFLEETQVILGPWIGNDSDRKMSIDNPAANGTSSERLPQALRSTSRERYLTGTIRLVPILER
ncbi:MAG: hypothetical protein ACYSWZ_06170 [Planctomycetota bacterium]